MRTPWGVLGGSVLLFVLGTGQVQGQIREVEDEVVESGPARFQAGAQLNLALPQGEFSEFVDAGFGFGGWAAINLDQRGMIALKIDANWLIYGSETRRRPLSPTIPFVDVDVTTRNNIYTLGLGPLISFGDGAIKPYIGGTVGFSYFSTESGVSGTNNGEDFASSTNFDDFTFSLVGGGGLRIRVKSGRTPIYIDLVSEYHRNGRASYLREGSIIDNGNGTISFTPIQSETNLMLIKLGVSGSW
jgi:hypothetical protein